MKRLGDQMTTIDMGKDGPHTVGDVLDRLRCGDERLSWNSGRVGGIPPCKGSSPIQTIGKNCLGQWKIYCPDCKSWTFIKFPNP